MFKKTVLLGAAIAACAALIAPAAATAEVAKNFWHNGPLLQDATLTLHGNFNFTSSAGGISCDKTMTLTLTPGSTGHVTAFAPSQTNTCTYSGNLDNLCGTVDTHQATGLPWTVHGTKVGILYKFYITNLHTDTGGTGIFCPDVTIKGDVTLIFEQNPVSTLIVHNTLTSNLGTNVTAGGKLHVTPAGTYGLEP